MRFGAAVSFGTSGRHTRRGPSNTTSILAMTMCHVLSGSFRWIYSSTVRISILCKHLHLLMPLCSFEVGGFVSRACSYCGPPCGESFGHLAQVVGAGASKLGKILICEMNHVTIQSYSRHRSFPDQTRNMMKSGYTRIRGFILPVFMHGRVGPTNGDAAQNRQRQIFCTWPKVAATNLLQLMHCCMTWSTRTQLG